MAAPAYLTSGNVPNAQHTTMSFTIPAGATTDGGSILLVCIEADGTATSITPPAGVGWTHVTGSPHAGAPIFACFWKRVLAGEPGAGTGNFTLNALDWSNTCWGCFTGCALSGDPQSANATSVFNASGTSVVLPSITTADADCLLVGFASESAVGDTHSTASGMTERQDFDGGALYDVAQAVAGASGSKTITLASTATGNGGYLVALKPEPAAGAPGPPLVRAQSNLRLGSR